MSKLSKQSNENERQYLWRVGKLIDAGLYKNWESIVDSVNAELREDESLYRTESAYRKRYAEGKGWYEDVFSNWKDDEYVEQIRKEKEELFKIKRQMFDQRREYNKILTQEARDEHLYDYIKLSADMLNEQKPLPFNTYTNNNNERVGVAFWTDWHYGMVTDNIWNKYNTDICKERVVELVGKTKYHLKTHKISKLYILLLGDACAGAIHTGVRVASNEDTCDQIMQVSEIMAEAVSELSLDVSEIEVHSTYGNHLRTIQNKKDSKHSDNMEKLIPWWLRERLKDNKKVKVIDSDYKEFIRLNLFGFNLCATHGDKENFKAAGVTINAIFNKVYGESIDYVVTGDKHHLEEFEAIGIETILIRSLAGTDDYADDKRLYSYAGQSLMIFAEGDGRECTYNMVFRQ